MDTTSLIFVRHGESLQNRGDITGEADSGLTELGWRQSVLVADWLARTHEVQVVLSSSMRRARQTAELIGRRLGLPLVVVPELDEANRSYWDELPAAHQAGPLSLWDEVWLPSAENAPSYSEFRSRLRHALEGILSAHSGKTAVIVSHGGSIGTILRSLFGGHAMPVFTQNTGVTELAWKDGHWQLVGHNLQEHLSPLLTSPAASGAQAGSERFPWKNGDTTQAAQSFYRRVARLPESPARASNGALSRLVELAASRSLDAALDVGCGKGALALALAPRATRVIGIDASAAMLERAELSRLAAGCENLDFTWAQAADLPVADASQSLVASRDLWSHLALPQAYLGEARRVLHPFGRLLVDDVTGNAESVKRATQEAIEIRRNPALIRLLTRTEIERLVAEAGFQIDHVETYQVTLQLDDWLTEAAADDATRSEVRKMIEAGMEGNAAGLHASRRRNGAIVFTQQRLRLLASIRHGSKA